MNTDSGAGRLGRRTLRLEFTCRACGGRTTRMINPDAYKSGTCIVQCASCGKHHIISDHLDYIERGFSTVVDYARSKGIPDILLRDVAELSKDETSVADMTEEDQIDQSVPAHHPETQGRLEEATAHSLAAISLAQGPGRAPPIARP
eukprot:CAMPEP_0206008724 /NCGR_PEP_ID=MMETSP1464-20131121/8249_1 /ASSEMBLY_ACC=CAM_ASM_001124 /TAXON_ID=119497 /ORGANISM="Exanthemachrysis gayraliae, Strain RCC1523" /LENGTH=146 /DNA_ID=CAMNT_0053382281 /DNA_START=59 /DNA_END=497 /DNA_ORIENTATION=+